MSVEVLDISIIGLAIGGLVHMVPVSLFTHNHTTLLRVSKVEVGFDCQLYVTTHSHCLTLSDGLLVDMASTIFTVAIRRIH